MGEDLEKTSTFEDYLECFYSLFEIVHAVREKTGLREKLRQTQVGLNEIRRRCRILKIDWKMTEIDAAWEAYRSDPKSERLMIDLIQSFSSNYG